MTKTNVITARLDASTVEGLDKLSQYHERSRSWLIAKAVAKYVKEETAFFEFLQEGDDAIDRGEYLTQEEMEAWFENRIRQRKAA